MSSLLLSFLLSWSSSSSLSFTTWHGVGNKEKISVQPRLHSIETKFATTLKKISIFDEPQNFKETMSTLVNLLETGCQ